MKKLIKKLIDGLKKNDKFVENIISKYPIQNNKIVFCDFHGKYYGGNPKYITEELLKRDSGLDIVWFYKDEKKVKYFPQNARLIKYCMKDVLFELLTAKVWVDSVKKVKLIDRGLVKRPEQIYIQTWHGVPLKKIDADSKTFLINNSEDTRKLDSEFTDYWVSNSTFESGAFKTGLWADDKRILEFGHARNDIFFSFEESIKRKVYEELGINDLTKKILLYAPTFRDDDDVSFLQLDYDKLKDALPEDYVIVQRLHPNIMKNSLLKKIKIPDYVIDGSFYSDIQELLTCIDIGITDYSSWIFDFMLTKRPVFIFATDIEKYNNDRGFYFSLDSTPFPIAKNTEELINNIKDFDFEIYEQKITEFLNEKGCIDDGKASERIADFIENIISENKLTETILSN